MKKKTVIILAFICSAFGMYFINNVNTEDNIKVVSYNGSNLRISIDGSASNTLPTSGNYYLTSYDCNSTSTTITWDKNDYKLNISNGTKKSNVACYLEFKSTPLLSEMETGSYVKYVGNNGCEGKSCEGQNANYIDDNEMGYCGDRKFKINGWRIGYINDDNVYLISAGSTDCMCSNSDGTLSSVACSGSLSSSDINKHYDNMNAIALKYCNVDYVYDGVCNTDTVRAMNGTDFYEITGKDLRINQYSYDNDNDLLYNGGLYWFASINSGDTTITWDSLYRSLRSSASSMLAGVRPVLKLDDSVVVTGGSGTYEEPYEIANNYFYLQDGDNYLNGGDELEAVVLNLNAASNVTRMCISVDTSVCTNYVAFSDNYTLDWSNEDDGEKVVYVYYKDSSGEIVASMNKTIVVDTVAPTNNSIIISDTSGVGVDKTLTLSSTDAVRMCFSNTSNSASNCTDWVDYATTYEWQLSEGVGNKTIYAFFKDEAGNIGSALKTTTCNSFCIRTEYFVDAYNSNYIYLMRNDGATALVSTPSSSITWHTEHSKEMHVCAATKTTNVSSSHIYCIGTDNKLYEKSNYSSTSWSMLSVPSGSIDTSNYNYFLYLGGSNVYIVRDDGMINMYYIGNLQLDVPSGAWTYGYATDMVACTGHASSNVACLGANGYYYYRSGTNAYSTTTAYLGGAINNKTTDKVWIDMYSNTYTHIIESLDDKIYNLRTSATGLSNIWITSDAPGGGVVACAASGENAEYNYCLSTDGYLYYKYYTGTSWSKTSLKYK